MSKQNNRRGNRNAKSKTRSAECQNKDVRAKYSKDNDPSWYAANEQILKDSATLAFSTMQGSKLSIPNMPARMPGIMRIDLLGVPGISDGSTSAVNIASRNIYSYVRHANSGAANYEAPDLMLYLLAMDQAYMYYSWMRRIYCTFRTYFQRNYYTPKWIIESMGVDYADLESKLSDFRLYINIFAQKCGSLVTPSGMTFLTRHSWLNSNIFADAPTDKAQFIYFNTPYFGIFSPRTSTKGGELIYTKLKPQTGKITLDRIIEFGNSILEPLIADEDINIMSGDILKAFGDSVNKLALVNENDVILPVYSPEVLTQIQNLREIPLENPEIRVSQENGYLITNYSTLKFVSTDVAKLKLDADNILNMPMTDPTPGDVMVATRLMGVLESTAENAYRIASCGTEICLSVGIYTLNEDGKGLTNSGSGYLATVKSSGTGDVSDTVKMVSLKAVVDQLANLAVFNSHPKALIAIFGTDNSLIYSRLVMELDNYTVINPSDVKQMDDVAVLNEFDVPQMGVYKA